jgi:hypothetical protein
MSYRRLAWLIHWWLSFGVEVDGPFQLLHIGKLAVLILQEHSTDVADIDHVGAVNVLDSWLQQLRKCDSINNHLI